MLSRILQVVALVSLAAMAAHAFAEDAQPDREQIREQFRQAREDMMKKMQDQGIDPQEFFRDIGQQMRDGTLDFAGMQKKLLDKGLIDQKQIDQMQQMQTRFQGQALDNIKRQLNVDEAEWNTLKPKIERVIAATTEVNSGTPLGAAFGGGFGFNRGGQAATGKVSAAAKELQAAIKNPDAPPTEYQVKLTALRDAKKKAQDELTAAQKDLTEVLTVSQEAQLTLLGLL